MRVLNTTEGAKRHLAPGGSMSIKHTTVAAVVAGAILYALPVARAGEPGGDHAPGIYLAAPGKDGAEAQIRIVGAMPHEVKTTGLGKMMLTQGLVKGSTVYELAGETADVRSASTSPTFYFYFGAGQSSSDPMAMMSQMMGGDVMPAGAKTAADFSMVHLTLADGNRQANMGKVGGSGKPKDPIDCTEERLAQGEYRLQPKSPLVPGEYAFVFTNSMGAAGGMTVWDFGIDAGKSSR